MIGSKNVILILALAVLSACSHSTAPATPETGSTKAGSIFSYTVDGVDILSGASVHQTEEDTAIAVGLTWYGQPNVTRFDSAMRDWLPYLNRINTGSPNQSSSGGTGYASGPSSYSLDANGDVLFPAIRTDTSYYSAPGQKSFEDSSLVWWRLPMGSHQLIVYNADLAYIKNVDTIQWISGSNSFTINAQVIPTEHVRLSQVRVSSPNLPPHVTLCDYYYAPLLGVFVRTDLSIPNQNGTFTTVITKSLTGWK